MNAMRYRFPAFFAVAIAAMTSSGGAWSSPDDPNAKVPPTRYSPVMAGAKTYRPVEPMPWGDVNRRVAPKPPQKPAR